MVAWRKLILLVPLAITGSFGSATETPSAPSIVIGEWEPVPKEKLSFKRELGGMHGQATLTVKVIDNMLYYTAQTACTADPEKEVIYEWQRSDALTNTITDCFGAKRRYEVTAWLRFFEPLPRELAPYTQVPRNVMQRKK